MSVEHPLILYVGDGEFGCDLYRIAKLRGCSVLLAWDAKEALALYILYAPDVILLEKGTDFVGEARFHLDSVGAEVQFVTNEMPDAVLDALFTMPISYLEERKELVA